MSKAKTSLEDLRMHMFDVIERLKTNDDPDADPKDKINIETAKAITDAGKIIIDAAKAEIEALKIISSSDVPVEKFISTGATKLIS